MEYSAIPNHEEQEEEEEVAITVRDNEEEEEVAITVRENIQNHEEEYFVNPFYSSMAQQLVVENLLFSVRTVIMCGFAMLQIPLENNTVFAHIAIVATLAVLFLHGCLGLFLVPCFDLPSWDICFIVLKLIGCFSTFLASFSLLMVLALPPELNWIGYLLACLMLGIILAYLYLDDQQHYKRSYPPDDLPLVVCNIIFHACAIPCLPDWILHPVLYICFGLEIAYHLNIYLMFINKQLARKPIEQLNITHEALLPV